MHKTRKRPSASAVLVELILLKKSISIAFGSHFLKKGFFFQQLTFKFDEKGFGTFSIHLKSSLQKPIDTLKKLLGQINPASERIQPFDQPFIDRIDVPNLSNWCSLTKKAIHLFKKTDLKKVVLSRCSHFIYKESISPFKVLLQLEKSALNSTVFAWIPEGDLAFLGASPEMLYVRELKNIRTEAVAGTRPRGHTEKQDKDFCEELKFNKKETKEFSFVSEFFESLLPKICNKYQKDKEMNVSKTSTVQHLHESFRGILKENVSDKQLLNTLHPTPAMGGTPTELSLDFIKNQEAFL